MSTKNLARTVIEGGRHNSNKFDRRNSSAEERVRARDFCKKVISDPELADELDIEERQPVYKGFTDKLAPMYRWLDSQVGRPWSEVRSEVFQNFDTRTTAGRHITFDHLLRGVVETDSGFNEYGHIVDPNIPKEENNKSPYGYRNYSDYYVDQSGILCKPPGSRRHRYGARLPLTEKAFVETSKWLNGCMIKEVAGKLHWLTPNDGIWMCSWLEPNISGALFEAYARRELSYYLLDNGSHEEKRSIPYHSIPGSYTLTIKVHGDFWNKIEFPFSFRLRGELSYDDLQYLRNLDSRLQGDILAYTKKR